MGNLTKAERVALFWVLVLVVVLVGAVGKWVWLV